MSISPQSPPIDVDWDEDIPWPDVSNFVTEDDTPVDNLFSEKQMRLLTESLTASWHPDFPFVTMANVGVYVALNRPPIVPDVLVTTHVEPLKNVTKKENRAYFSWNFGGKPPEIVIEIVSNRKGNELDSKLRSYEHMGVTWYVVFDPYLEIQKEMLVSFGLTHGRFSRQAETSFDELGIGLKVWQGEFEGARASWLRWVDADGNILKTGQELAAAADKQAAKARHEADKANQRVAALEAKLRALGIDSESAG